VAETLDLPQHVLRFWETRFVQIKPLKRGGGRRYYRPDDVDLLRGIRQLLYDEGFTIKGVQRILKEQGPRFVISAGRGELDSKPSLMRPAEAGVRESEREERTSRRAAEIASTDGLDWQDDVDSAPRIDEPADIDFEAPVDSESRPQPRAAEFSKEQKKVLQATLAELLECRRLLDETR
jgi:DNA-binding transcriptional MerR regulator